MKDGGPAFPNQGIVGMRLRDYFAGQAIGDVIAAHHLGTFSAAISNEPSLYASFAAHAYAVADAMLAEREKGR